MNDEKLIELVRQHGELYDVSSKEYRYTDSLVKLEIWKEIGLIIGRPGSECRRRWTSLRDQFRKFLRNKTRNGQAAATSGKQWKYEKQMSFLKPHFRERGTYSNVPEVEEVDTFRDDECSVVDVNSSTCSNSESVLETPEGRTKMDKPQESAPSLPMQYLITKNEDSEAAATRVRQFFLSMADTVAQFSPLRQIEAKNKVFQIVTALETEQVKENQNLSTTFDHCYSS